MEEEVLKILINNETIDMQEDRDNVLVTYLDAHDYSVTAKEITSMVMEFIEWEVSCLSVGSLKSKMPHYDIYKMNHHKDMNFNELFEYWINNIRKP